MTDTAPTARKIALRKPIHFAGEVYGEVTLREPMPSQVEKVAGMGDVEASMELIFQTSGLIPGAVAAMGARDFKACTAWINECCKKQPAIAEPAEGLTIPLRKPVTHEAGTIFKLALREPTAGELKEADRLSGIAEIVSLIAIITGEPAEAVGQIGMREYRQAEAYLLGFL
jgi:hypothetical protein